MSRVSDRNLRPRNGHTLEVLDVCRISGCPKQKEVSNEDQNDNARDIVKSLFDDPSLGSFRLVSCSNCTEPTVFSINSVRLNKIEMRKETFAEKNERLAAAIPTKHR